MWYIYKYDTKTKLYIHKYKKNHLEQNHHQCRYAVQHFSNNNNSESANKRPSTFLTWGDDNELKKNKKMKLVVTVNFFGY